MAPQPFNVFQRVMRLWDRVHPYNAGQVIRLTRPIDADRWVHAWPRTLSRLGLGPVQIRDGAYRFLPPDEASGSDPCLIDVDLHSWLTGELNRPFAESDEMPFRPFVHPAGHVGIIYHHWAADSVSIRLLLREWFLAVHDPARCRTEPIPHPAGGYWRYFGPTAAGWALHEGALSLLRLRTRFGRVRRIAEQSPADHRVAFSLHETAPGLAPRLLRAAQCRGIKVNDLFTAAVAEACDQQGVNPPAPGREDLAIGTIVDIRPQSRRLPVDTFGMFLGFTTTIFRGADLRAWPRLLASAAAQSDLFRRTRAASASVLRLGVGVAEARLYDPQRWSARYRVQMPMAAGLSNVTLQGTWASAYHPEPVLDYFRVSPTSPLLPVVFTPTTLGDRLNLGLTRQVALIDEARASRMISQVMDRIHRVAEGSREHSR